MQLKRVVVTGIGALTPIGNNVQEYWDNLSKGTSGSGLITRFDTSNFKTKFACEVKGFNPQDHFDRKEARKLDLFTMYAMVASEEAFQDSKLNLETLNLDRAGVIFGSGIGGFTTIKQEMQDFSANPNVPRFNPFFIPKLIIDIAAGHLSMKYGFRGPNFATVSACATSSNAIIDAFNYIRLGKADVFITGGSEAAVNEPGVGGFNAMQALSTNNDEYESASRPFDATRDGFVMGEGSGTLILEELEHAKKRGAYIYCEVVGGGLTADAHHLTAPHPEGLGASNVMKVALEDAGLKPEDVDYINVHGTATPLGDIAETKAIKNVFGDTAYKLNISSTKSMTGHLLGAAGAVEAIASIMALNKSIIPPTINLKTLDSEIDPKLNLTPNKNQKRDVDVAVNNTFGFGGHNTSTVFKKFQE
jgi:3-oxoacyl-[acyl-carrier-protein] synthase II